MLVIWTIRVLHHVLHTTSGVHRLQTSTKSSSKLSDQKYYWSITEYVAYNSDIHKNTNCQTIQVVNCSNIRSQFKLGHILPIHKFCHDENRVRIESQLTNSYIDMTNLNANSSMFIHEQLYIIWPLTVDT